MFNDLMRMLNHRDTFARSALPKAPVRPDGPTRPVRFPQWARPVTVRTSRRPATGAARVAGSH